MDEGYKNLVAHFNQPADRHHEWNGRLKRKRQAANSRCSTPEGKVNGQSAANQSENPFPCGGGRWLRRKKYLCRSQPQLILTWA